MKQLTCEMCGSTDLIKQDGVFVCQTCGTKYSVEEARKMMVEGTVEVQGTVQVANAAQLSNLLKMAHSSYDSKNYAKAEEFCDQAIAMDDKNYEAWKLKGEAINYQINATNQRILEVYNCLMTAYRSLDDDGKAEKKYEILASLKTCFEGEVDFWLKQFEANRPTDAALKRVENAYTDAYNKMKAAFEELGLEESKKGYLIKFDNFFIGKCNATCNSAWKTTVGYNYYRDYMGQGIDPFGRSSDEQRWIIPNTKLYRPTKKIWDTFLTETNNLIRLLQFAEDQFNDETDPKVMEAIYSNIAFFFECYNASGSWQITTGTTGFWDGTTSVGWKEEYWLSDKAKATNRERMNKYREKAKTIPAQAEARQKAKRDKAREEYWNAHTEEKEKLNAEKASLKQQIQALLDEESRIESKDEIMELRRQIESLTTKKKCLGMFAGKEKKALQDQIDKVSGLMNDKIEKAKSVIKAKIAPLSKRVDEIDEEFSRDR